VSDSAYYIPNEKADTVKLPTGEYEAIIDTVETTKDVKCGGFIADIFKPVYTITDKEHGKVTIKDNGVFRYKEKPGYQFQASRNWGYAKFCEILGLDKQRDGKIHLPFIEGNMIDGYNVKVAINYKHFVNEGGMRVSYPVATLKKKLKEVPF
tara:strand:+ start:2825 stop:3280 length:456 start_codon:yes stop_codon:yes gene_type:complete